MFWIFAIVVFLVITGFYLWIEPIRNGINNAVVIAWYWTLININLPQWFQNLINWLGRVWQGLINGVAWIIVRVLWLLAGSIILFGFAVDHFQDTGDPIVLLVVMGIFLVIGFTALMFSNFLSNLISNFLSFLIQLFGGEGRFQLNREVTQGLALFFLFMAAHTAFLTWWLEVYLAHMVLIICMSLLFFGAFHAFGLSRNLPATFASWTLLFIFLGINISAPFKPQITTWMKKKQITDQKEETSHPVYDVENKYAETWTTARTTYAGEILNATGNKSIDSVWTNAILRVNPKDISTVDGVPHFKVKFYVKGQKRSEGYYPFDGLELEAGLDWSNPTDYWAEQVKLVAEAEANRVATRPFSVKAGKILVKNITGQDIHARVGSAKQYFPESDVRGYEIPVASNRTYIVSLPKKYFDQKKFTIKQI